ncbi:MAG TPA: protein phosphatase 2C domain-containing protein [Streptosporangiaceae bacterium]|nr:protein phosphatase 2C domain-containing protein [Streptosporangiaceae bacterium]
MAKGKFPFGDGKRAGNPGKHAGRPADVTDPAAAGEPPDEPTHHGPPAEPSDWPISVSFTGPPATPDDVRRWATIIVDEPIMEFEPKPPSSRFYLADTIFDGWSTEHFTIRLASVRGYSHRYRGVPRQDDAQVVFHPESGTVLFAVADGVSGASESHVGATVACSRTVETMQSQLISDHAIDLAHTVQVTAQQLTAEAADLLGQDQPTLATVEDLLATTLVAGYIQPGPEGATVAIVQIGDSGAWILRGNRYYPLLGRKNDPDAQVISSAVSPLPRIPEHLTPTEFRLPPDAVLLIGTDGFGDPLGDGEGKIGQLFAEHLRTPPPARGLAHLLDFSRDTFDDDRALIVIWQKAEAPEVPP